MMVFLLYRSELSPFLSYGLFFTGFICVFLGLSIAQAGMTWLLASARIIEAQPMQTAPDADALPAIPCTLDEVFQLNPKEFEVLSAAVVVGMGEGHRFLKHCGQSGDQGIDAKLLNQYHLTVAIQSKLYDNKIISYHHRYAIFREQWTMKERSMAFL